MGWAEAGLEEDTAVGDGLQGRGALVREAKAYEKLRKENGATVGEGAGAPGSQAWDIHGRRPGQGAMAGPSPLGPQFPTL